MTTILWNFAAFVVALGILVAIHEFGHFWVARRCGVKVERFSIGFGKALWTKKGRDGTEYALCLIPLGGYVKMLDSRVDEIDDAEQPFAFDHQPLWQRAAIVAAGPIFNFLFAIVAYWFVFIIGTPAVKPVIGEVVPNSIVAEAGLQPNMELKAVSGVQTADWESVNMALISHIGESRMTLTVAPADGLAAEKTIALDLTGWNFDPEHESAMGALGFKPFMSAISLTLQQVTPEGAAAKAGLVAGDTLVSVDGKPLTQWQQVVTLIQNHPNTPLDVEVERDSQRLAFTLIPDSQVVQDRTIGFAGIVPKVAPWPAHYRFELQYGVVESIGKAVEKTGQVISLTASMLEKLVVGDVGLNNLSGPISIAKGAGATADYGLVYFLGFLALISVNLGIINLVPLPMLDGGHLLFFAVEAVMRRPVPEKVQEMGFKIGGAIIFSLMAVAIFNDFTRL